MPRYDYFCKSCEETHEQTHSIFGNHVGCPNCGRYDLKKVIHPTPVRFKGSGWASKA